MMIKKLKLALATSALVVGGLAGFAAADSVKDAKHEARKAELLAKFDTNKDGKLDDTERAAAKDARAAERFKQLDTNGDGKLSLEEFKAGRQGRGGMHRHHRGPGRGQR